jgi:hypothetical protein
MLSPVYLSIIPRLAQIGSDIITPGFREMFDMYIKRFRIYSVPLLEFSYLGPVVGWTG